eukprot:CAMPEP_0173234202 /NCGR_PEP_ID=MMETSP1142-20121109/10078_1 /TAXON_ID=483371 /ORGANISM="non described non described, Strain CCMP2298" /LENGTH=70 /DNA_ID=CAMNT_0014164183 /DNA_START=904 /DNA_END=1116 /DNA_ORIENTATION=-
MADADFMCTRVTTSSRCASISPSSRSGSSPSSSSYHRTVYFTTTNSKAATLKHKSFVDVLILACLCASHD